MAVTDLQKPSAGGLCKEGHEDPLHLGWAVTYVESALWEPHLGEFLKAYCVFSILLSLNPIV